MNTLRLFTWTTVAFAIALPLPLAAQQLERDVGVVSAEVEGRLEGFSFQEGPVSKLEFKGTAVSLAAEGDGEVEFQDGRSRVEVSVEKLPAPSSLGPFSTYVLWAVSGDGRASNLGSIEVRNGSGSLETSTSLSQFALVVTAEPHFAVTAPSKYMVLRNLGKRIRGTTIQIPGLRERMDYSGLSAQRVDPKSKIPLELIQARYAIEIARRVDAEDFAPGEFSNAELRLSRAEEAQSSKEYRARKTVPLLARDAVQMGEDARRKAVLGRQAAEGEAATAAARQEAEEKARQAAGIAAEQAKQRQMLAAEEAARQAALEAEQRARADLTARLNRALPTRQTERGIVAEIAGVQFATGAATLNASAREALARFSGIVGVYPSLRFKVEGHTDSTGSAETNRILSRHRATTVRDYLIGQGVDAGSISIEGLGPDQPVADNATSEGRARNRRVEIILTGDLVTAPSPPPES
jgi:outer membrane protein OmpA-like peptidoglycan-associated protein